MPNPFDTCPHGVLYRKADETAHGSCTACMDQRMDDRLREAEATARIEADRADANWEALKEARRERDDARRYGTCLPGCNWHETNSPKDCDCGWYSLKATWDPEIKAALGGEAGGE